MRALLLLPVLALSAFAPPAPGPVAFEVSIEDVEFRLRNDTGSSVRIHTGTGTSTIGNGSSNRYEVEVGQEFRLDNSSGPLLFEVEAEMDGETLDLSDYV